MSDQGYTLLCGYGRRNILPDEPVPLASFGNELKRISTGLQNEILFSAIALTDLEGQTILLMSYDITQANALVTEKLKEYGKEKYGLAPEYVHLSGTHTHSSVSLNWYLPGWEEVLGRYQVKLLNAAYEAIDEAMADRKPARLYFGQTKTEGLNFVRHYVAKSLNPPKYFSDNFGIWDKVTPIEHTKAPDETMRVLKFTRTNADGTPAKDVVIANWQAHNHISGSSKSTLIASDWSGAFRTVMEEKQNCLFTFFQGCAGNLNPKSRNKWENRTLDYMEYGGFLAGYLNEIYDSMEESKNVKIRAITEEFTYASNIFPKELIEPAKAVIEEWKKQGMNNRLAQEFAETVGLSSVFHARRVLASQESPAEYTVNINAYTLGEIGWTSCPNEMFDDIGVEIRAASPFRMTITQGYTDGVAGYLPYRAAYEYGCYEACTTRFAKGAAEAMRDQLVGMLKKLA